MQKNRAGKKTDAVAKYKDPAMYENSIRRHFDCMHAKEYQVCVTPRLYYRAVQDSRIAQWLEENLSQIPSCMKQVRDIVAVTGGHILCCTCHMINYQNISTQIQTMDNLQRNGIYGQEIKSATIRTATIGQIEDQVKHNSIFWTQEIKSAGFHAQA